MKILILASNPRKDLNLDREIRDLKEVIEKSRNREQFEVVIELAVRIEDLQDLMLRHEPQIVHFCGHGGGEEGLLFESDEVKEQLLQTQALSNLFGLCAEHLDCVLLNACYSEVQANEMIEHINYVIGMSQTIQDNASIAFSKGFYRALGYARPIEEAYKFGCNAIQLEITGSSKVRSAATETERKLEVVDVIQNKVIPEHLKPILKKKRTLSISAPAPALPQETQTAIRLEIAESLTENSSSDQYRAKVREFLNDRKLSALETIRLEQLRKDLRLSEEEASQNLVEELELVQKGRDEYKAMLIGLIEKGLYPLDAETEAELLAVQQELGLTDEEVAVIATPILGAAEEDYKQVKVTQQQSVAQQRSSEEQQQKQASIPTALLLSEKPAVSEDISKAEAVEQIFAEVHYSTLRDLLVSRRWQEADQETFKVMLKIIGTTDNWITDNEIATFPRKDLHMIDQLWNQSSNGLFGFSIQKRVWLSVGGQAGKHDFKIYEDFGERLGWRLNNEWVNYENLTFSLDAPEGHLPICGYATDGSWMRWDWALFSRRDW